MQNNVLDVFIIGGGINGAGIARDAAGRGLKVMLVEQNDLASATSSASSKLIHGGLRYLEYYKFALVRKALIERELLLNAAPHIIWPARFVVPHAKHLRPKWLIRLGLFLYDGLNLRQKLKRSRSANLAAEAYGDSLKAEFTAGFVYSDCRVHDSRLVVLNAQDAQEKGASINPNTQFVSAEIVNGLWQIITQNKAGEQSTFIAKTLVNAAGPWVDIVNDDTLKMAVRGASRLVTGSHIVVPKIYDGEQCYLFQNEDNRVAFAIPYEGEFTLIGTTDVAFKGDVSKVKISTGEKEYLIEIANQYFTKQLRTSDIIWDFAGVRSLFDDKAKDAKSVTREYILDIHHKNNDENNPPLLTVYGGKITTFRHLGEAACHKLKTYLPNMGSDWTKTAHLPGGDINTNRDIKQFITELKSTYSWLPESLVNRLATHYGNKTKTILGTAKTLAALGENLGYDIYTAELDYVIKYEWVTCAEDYIWRRTRLGLHIDKDTQSKIENYIKAKII